MAVSAILNFGQFLIFYLDDIEGRVIPLLKGFPRWESISAVILDQVKVKSEVKVDLKSEIIISIDRLYVVRCLPIPECQCLLGWVGRYVYVWYVYMYVGHGYHRMFCIDICFAC